jgi:hypothetical protein
VVDCTVACSDVSDSACGVQAGWKVRAWVNVSCTVYVHQHSHDECSAVALLAIASYQCNPA